jgi:S-DNA-T family DNA segregation ATPase FtsK/SpoIIIE
MLLSLLGGVKIGGSVGGALSEPIRRAVGTTGSAIAIGLAIAYAMAFVFHLRVTDLLRVAAVQIGQLLFLFVIAIPIWAFRVGTDGLRLLVGGTVGLTGRLFSSIREAFRHAPPSVLEEEPVLPKPRNRKNRIVEEQGEPPPIEVPSESPEDEERTLVVVQRKGGGGRLSQREFEKAQKKLQSDEPDVGAFADYQPPGLNLLVPGEAAAGAESEDELREKSRQIESKLKDFGIMGRVTHVHPGPVITLFEFEPAAGVKVGKIAALTDDLAMGLRASSIRIIAPIPRRGTVGIEVPNRNRELVRLRDVLESEAFVKSDSNLCIPMGKDTYGEPLVCDIAAMPHLLLAGTTGTGKSVCINSILVSLLYRATPAELGLILIDPKVLELSTYDGIPHLRVPVVTVPKQARAVLQWAVNEMERRYRFMQQFGVRNVDSYNRLVAGEIEGEFEVPTDSPVIDLPEEIVVVPGEATDTSLKDAEDLEVTPKEALRALPKIVIVIDELADLMLTVGRDIEELITRLAQKARAAGIHLIVATQRPSVDVITGLIKANFPARISFRVSSRIDSRTILDTMGAEKLLGRGDMLFMQPGAESLRRVHGAFVSDAEVKRVVSAVRAKCKPQYDERILAICERALEESDNPGGGGDGAAPGPDDYDPVYDKAVEVVLQKGHASTSMIQRVFRIGYNRAARIIEVMERDGIVGPADGAKPRQVLLPPSEEAEKQPAAANGAPVRAQPVAPDEDDLF